MSIYIHTRTRYSSRCCISTDELRCPAVLENSPVVSQIDIVRQPKVRRCLRQALLEVLCAPRWLCMAWRGVRRGVWRYVPAGSSQNTTLNALSPPQRLSYSSQIIGERVLMQEFKVPAKGEEISSRRKSLLVWELLILMRCYTVMDISVIRLRSGGTCSRIFARGWEVVTALVA